MSFWFQVQRGGEIVATASFERVMDGLGEEEKYNAVLQGLSSLLISKKYRGGGGKDSFQEVSQLLDEMHANKIKCTTRTGSVVVDAATATANVSIIAQGTTSIFSIKATLDHHRSQHETGPAVSDHVPSYHATD